MVCRSIHSLPSELETSNDKLNVEDEEEEDDDDDDDKSSSMLPSDCDSFNEKRELSSMSDEVTIMVRRALFSSIRIASRII